MSFVSYAQNGEDVLLHRVFGGQETGFYVDVGAYHPVEGSVTKAFYDRGWAGINLEPGQVFDALAAARPRDVNLRMAVLDRTGTVAFLQNPADAGMSHVAADDQAEGTVQVPCDTLENIVRRHSGGRPVDFLKVDAEGAEAAIVASTDWRRFRPRVLVFEATLPWSATLSNAEWEPGLLQGGYVRAYFDGINCYYLPEEEVPVLGRHFAVPVNVLDGVQRHDAVAQREAAQVRIAALEAQCQEARAALDWTKAEVERTRAEGERIKATARAEQAEARSRSAALQAELEGRLAGVQGDRDGLAQALEACRAERDEARSRIPAPEAPVAVAPPPPPVARGRPLRRIARFAYSLIRPAVRPVTYRFRTFMTVPQREAFETLRQELAAGRAQVDQAVQTLAQIRGPSHVEVVTAPAELAEMRRLAAEMERTLLTLALESGSAAVPQGAGPAPPAAPAVLHAPLLLAGGRRTEVEFVSADLSVGAALAASGGDWEPHVRGFLEARVQADWTCIDIGANIGAHTLSLAAMATAGRVIAFEADPLNHASLVRNAARLARPKAGIEPLNLALWDSTTKLTIGGADELAGCSFVSAGDADAASTEAALRSVVDSPAVAATALHLRLARIDAVRLDDWAADHALERLDFVKLDVEGAEANVIRGADRTLRRLRPILLVEYNPACAAAYFGQAPEALFLELQARFAAIHALEQDGTLVLLDGWDALRSRLDSGRGWEDLVCLPAG